MAFAKTMTPRTEMRVKATAMPRFTRGSACLSRFQPSANQCTPLGGEGERRHVERRSGGEGAEQGEPEEEVGTGEELAEPGHPDAPDAGPEVNARITFGKTQ